MQVVYRRGFRIIPSLLSRSQPSLSWKENSLQRLRSSMQDLVHEIDCPASEPLGRTILGSTFIFDLRSNKTIVDRLLGLHPWSSFLSPSLGRVRELPLPPLACTNRRVMLLGDINITTSIAKFSSYQLVLSSLHYLGHSSFISVESNGGRRILVTLVMSHCRMLLLIAPNLKVVNFNFSFCL